MSDPIILSDEDDPNTPLPLLSKKRRTEPDLSFPSVVVVVDDPTPRKSLGPATSTPSFVPETPMSEPTVVKCSYVGSSVYPEIRVSNTGSSNDKLSGISRLICLESDNESESGSRRENLQKNETTDAAFDELQNFEWCFRISDSTSNIDSKISGNANEGQMCEDNLLQMHSQDNPDQVIDDRKKENFSMGQMDDIPKRSKKCKVTSNKRNGRDGVTRKQRMTEEERARLKEEKKLKKEQEKLQKAAQKAEAAELKKLQKEKQKWEKGKFALKSIVAEIDTKVVELGSVGGHLLSRLADKGLRYRITSNPVERSIVWTMTVPESISQLSPRGVEIPYILLVYGAAEFCDHVTNETLFCHLSKVRSQYPNYTVCCLINRLLSYISGREREQYKDPTNGNGWQRPPVEEVLAKLTTHYARMHSRQCADEAELAEHVVGLTSSLASCQFRKKLTRLSVNANGSLVPKDFVYKNLIKESLWLKALLAIPKVQPRFALAIREKYPTMKSLLQVYMDPCKSVHEKEFLLEDLPVDGGVGNERRLGEVCSKRVYRILMAQSGSIKTDDVEDGADLFRHE
ncbi:hypothetical protein SLEP1_g34693 [Rubroshorea leprosula]|uniref:ERCC4 domain-containing protein n=3 Tax=Rubroshorea leprosula TaxID=152421 RepID=A0AAV5KL64_9ROSI|nr:hypothetical protein SLEP1_g34693 [Rubroshorea leprosula]